jgi:transposase
MTKAVEVITSVQRRRRWWRAEKERIVAAALEPGAVACKVARATGIHTSQLFRWRQELGLPAAPPAFTTVAVLPEPGVASPPPETAGVIEIEFPTGGRMRITGVVEAATVSALMKALSRASGGDDPGPERRAGLAGGRPHRHAQGFDGLALMTGGCRKHPWRPQAAG